MVKAVVCWLGYVFPIDQEFLEDMDHVELFLEKLPIIILSDMEKNLGKYLLHVEWVFNKESEFNETFFSSVKAKTKWCK